jgi:high-affinity iron transporter
MWQGFTISLREGIESFLIVALTLSYLKRTGRPLLARAVYAGIAVSIVACVGAGLFFSQAEKKPLWEGVLALTAAGLVGSLLVYMKRVSSRMKADMERRIETRARAFSPHRAFWGVFAFTVLMMMREGLETALLVATAFLQLHSATVTAGLGLGVIAAAAIAFTWTRLGRGVDLRGLLNVSAIFLALFLVQLLLYGVHELSEAGVLPASQTVHDATEILGPDGRVGHLLAYMLAIVPTAWLVRLWWKRRGGRLSAGQTRSAA